jgi:hypothetical protein
MLQQLDTADSVRRELAPRTAQKHKSELGQFMRRQKKQLKKITKKKLIQKYTKKNKKNKKKKKNKLKK